MWIKVQQRDVPGIDAAYLAMDTEEGVEVVWNEVRFSERKNFKAQEEKISQVFNNLIQLEHPNIVKFHKYWIDSRDDKPRVRTYVDSHSGRYSFDYRRFTLNRPAHLINCLYFSLSFSFVSFVLSVFVKEGWFRNRLNLNDGHNLGDFHHGVHVIGVVKTVSQTDQEERQETSNPGLETVVHPNPVCPQVSANKPTLDFSSISFVVNELDLNE